jgi:hypothetical protein
LVGILVMILLARFKEASFGLINRIFAVFSFLPKIMILARWGELIEGLAPVLRGVVVLQLIALSLLSWLISGIVFFYAIRTFEPMGLFL